MKERTKERSVARMLFPALILLSAFEFCPPQPLLAAVEPQGGNSTGAIQGRVLFEGGKTPEGVVVADTVIYLVGEGLGSGQPVASDPVLGQRDITFVPHVLPVVVGQKLTIHNDDTILHNVRTNSKKNKIFNIAQLGGGTFHEVFDVPEIIKVGCDIHSQMQAYIIVVPNPFFTRAVKDGTYTLTNVPPGKYELVGWHETYDTFTKKVEVTAGQASPVDVDFQKPLPKAKEVTS